MKNQAAHYDLIRDTNLRLVRNLVRKHDVVGKTELVNYSGLSFPTVSAVLNELVKTGEVLEQEGSSNGGRPGAVFRLNKEYESIACAAIKQYEIHIKVYDYCHNVQQIYREKIEETIDKVRLVQIFEGILLDYPNLRLAVIGIPGVVLENSVKYLPYLPQLEGVDIGNLFEKKLGIKTFLENDINTIIMGECDKGLDYAHVFWNQGCIGSAIMISGKLLQGAHGCAGELEYLCDEAEGSLICLEQALRALTCVVDVPLIGISGADISEEEVRMLDNRLRVQFPEYRMPQIQYVPDEEALYDNGLWQIVLDYCMNVE